MLLTASACSTEFDTYQEGQTHAVVYAAINPDDSLYAVRLSKSFVGEGSAFDFAREPDSLYFQEARVQLETFRNNQVFQTVTLNRSAVHDKNQGLFAEAPNYLYQVSSRDLWISQGIFESMGWSYDLQIRLSVIIPGWNDTIRATGRLLEHPRIINPRSQYKKVYLYGEVPFQMEWSHQEPGNYYEIQVDVRYREITGQNEQLKSCSWTLRGIEYNESSYPGSLNNRYSYYFRPESFYSQLAAAIDDSPGVNGRLFQAVDFTILTAEPALREYNRIDELHDDYRGSSYSNIIHGLGLFYTFNETAIRDLELGQRELDSLAFGHYTRHLKFKNWL